MPQRITLSNKEGSIEARVEETSEISQEERKRIEKAWEEPENQEKLEAMIRIYGEYKRVVDESTGQAYRVPTKDIIIKGLKQEDFKKYPLW